MNEDINEKLDCAIDSIYDIYDSLNSLEYDLDIILNEQENTQNETQEETNSYIEKAVDEIKRARSSIDEIIDYLDHAKNQQEC